MLLGDPESPGQLPELGRFLPRRLMVREGCAYATRMIPGMLWLLLANWEPGSPTPISERTAPDAGFRSGLSHNFGASPTRPRIPVDRSRAYQPRSPRAEVRKEVQRPLVALIQSEMRCTTIPSIPR
jgi:hypothetical protein